MNDAIEQAPPRAPSLYRGSLLALLIVLPAAIVLRGYEPALAWWRGSELFATQSAMDGIATYAGADWRVVSLRRGAVRPDGSAAVALELAATVTDPRALREAQCRIMLTDALGRRWRPANLPATELARLRLPGRETPGNCAAALGVARPGATLAIFESFLLPAGSAGEADILVSLASGRPGYLRFRRNP